MKSLLKRLFHPAGRAIDKDYRQFALDHAEFLISSSLHARPTHRLLIIGLHGFIPSVKLEGFMAKSLQVKGVQATVLLYKSQTEARRYFELFGIQDFLYFDDFLDTIDSSQFPHALDDVFKSVLSLPSLLRFEYRGVAVGKHALSLVTRKLHAGGLDLKDSHVVNHCRGAFLEGIKAVHAAELCFEKTRPDIVLFNERGYVPFGELFDVALKMKLNTIQYVGSHLDQAFHFKRYTYDMRTDHPISLHRSSWEALKEFPISKEVLDAFIGEHYQNYKTGSWYSRQKLQNGKEILDAERTRIKLDLDPSKKTAVIFSHVLWDATFFYGEGLFEDYAEWLVETVRAACANTHVNWIVKLHPANVWRLALDQYKGELAEHALLRKYIGRLPAHVKLLDPRSEINTFSLFDVANYCLTVRGTIGMEMPMFGIPVITGGTGRYSDYGFTVNSATKEEYIKRLSMIQDIPSLNARQIADARLHAYAIFKLRPLLFDSIRVVHAKEKNDPAFLVPFISCSLDNANDFPRSADFESFSQWALNGNRMDFMNVQFSPANLQS